MQARERGVLVREAGRLQRPVGIRALSDGVDEADVEQSRRRHGEQREERESDQPRSEHRVPQEVVVAAAVDVERHRDAQDHGPVAPDVHPVGGGHDGVAPEPRALQPLFPVDPEPSLEGEEAGRRSRRRHRCFRRSSSGCRSRGASRKRSEPPHVPALRGRTNLRIPTIRSDRASCAPIRSTASLRPPWSSLARAAPDGIRELPDSGYGVARGSGRGRIPRSGVIALCGAADPAVDAALRAHTRAARGLARAGVRARLAADRTRRE